MDDKTNQPGSGITPEQQVQSLLKRSRQEHNSGWLNKPLKDVPFAVIWNTFSRSNWRLEE